jgi:hypothetical protein
MISFLLVTSSTRLLSIKIVEDCLQTINLSRSGIVLLFVTSSTRSQYIKTLRHEALSAHLGGSPPSLSQAIHRLGILSLRRPAFHFLFTLHAFR